MAGDSHIAVWKTRRLRRTPAVTVPAPTISTCAPSDLAGPPGATVTIYGTNFVSPEGTNHVVSVHFDTSLATSFVVIDATTIAAVAPLASPSVVVVNTTGGCALFVAAADSGFTGQLGIGGSQLGNIVPGHV